MLRGTSNISQIFLAGLRHVIISFLALQVTCQTQKKSDDSDCRRASDSEASNVIDNTQPSEAETQVLLQQPTDKTNCLSLVQGDALAAALQQVSSSITKINEKMDALGASWQTLSQKTSTRQSLRRQRSPSSDSSSTTGCLKKKYRCLI